MLNGYGIRISRSSILERCDAAGWFLPDGHHGHKIGAKLGYLAAGNPRNQVQPVSADIGNGTELAAKFRIEPPVPIAWIEQPVLQETAMHEFGLTDSAFLN